jgi:hypothetical protein
LGPIFYFAHYSVFNDHCTPETEAAHLLGEKNKILETPEPVKMFYDVFQKRSSWCRVLVSGAKIAEPPTHVNSNNAGISKKHPAHEPASRNSLFFCNAPKNATPGTGRKP